MYILNGHILYVSRQHSWVFQLGDPAPTCFENAAFLTLKLITCLHYSCLNGSIDWFKGNITGNSYFMGKSMVSG